MTMTGGWRKKNKAALLRKLEKGVEPITCNVNEAVINIAGMAMIQKTKISGLTIGELAKQLFFLSGFCFTNIHDSQGCWGKRRLLFL